MRALFPCVCKGVSASRLLVGGLDPGIQDVVDQIREGRPPARDHSLRRSIDEFEMGDFTLEGYAPHPSIKAPIAV